MRQRASGPEGRGGPGSSPRSAAGSSTGSAQQTQAGRGPVLDAAQLEVLRRYGSEHDVAAGDVLFADGDETYDLIVLLAGRGPRSSRATASRARRLSPRYGPSQFLGEIGLLTGQRVFLSAVATHGRAGPAGSRRAGAAWSWPRSSGLSELILRTFLLRHSILTGRGSGLTLIGSRFDPDTRRLLEVLARNRLAVEVAGAGGIARGRGDAPGAGCARSAICRSSSSRAARCCATPAAATLLDALGHVRPGRHRSARCVRSAGGGSGPGRAGRRGLRGVRRDGHDPGRGHRARRPGGHVVADRELPGLPRGPVRGGAGGPRGLAGPEVRRPHQARRPRLSRCRRRPACTRSRSTTAR